GIYDPMGAQLGMYPGFKAVYFSGYSFAIGFLGTTDMALSSGPESADGARRTDSGLRTFQLPMAVGDRAAGIPPRRLEIPAVIAGTCGVWAIYAPARARRLDPAIDRACRYLDTAIPDLVCCEFPTSAREPVERFATEVRERFPEARFACNWASSFKWYLDDD